ncbi:hypothetical protein C882_2464 [Caenispirillum salinarum AK4]|uniref:Rv0623-like transcription factor n=1 Tax=Caenispirillum salinarum AK4 TaxID=1238182 RepID=K9H271_9PROT|nr:type II toxin-antitoxin system VapB family antitoxin [Caenispirillum salinarum]EKV32385.1 hypothetical protein C882_2464 [Caenispirillum salinarum AK4]
MGVVIESKEAETLLAELRAATGKGNDEIILTLLREAAQSRRPDAATVEERRRRLHEIIDRAAAKARPYRHLDHDAVIGYDEYGLPS